MGAIYIPSKVEELSTSLTGLLMGAAGSVVAAASGTDYLPTTGGTTVTTLGTVVTGTWSATAVAATNGGTGLAAYTLGDVLYSGAANTLAVLPGNTSSTRQFLNQTGTGTISAAPAWAALIAADIPSLDTAKVTTGTWAAARMPALTGDVTTTSGTVATAIGAGVVTNAMLAGSITASNLVGSDITTVGTVVTGTWSATAIAATRGGTGLTAYALGDVLYSSATNTLAALAGNTSSTKKFLRQTGTGTISAAPAWDTLVAGDVPNIAESQVTSLVSDLALKAPLASPTFTGTPAAPTAAGGTNTTQLATTAFVTAAVAAGGSVTAISVVSANGFAGSATATSTPAITLTTTVTGVLKGNGTAIAAASAGTDYLSPSGDGSALTSLNATALASGTVADARLSSNVFYVDGTRAGSSAATTGNAFALGSTTLTSGVLLKGTVPASGFTGSILKVADNAGSPVTKFEVSAAGAITTGTIAGASVTGTVAAAQMPAFSGNVTTSAGSTVTTIAAGVVTNAMLAGSITANNLVGSDITTVGTVTAGTWSATAIAATKGGTGLTAYTLGDVVYSSATNTLAALAGNTTSTKQFLNQTGTGSVSAAPAWAALVAADIPSLDTAKVTTGTWAAARMPALTGNVTTSAGSVATTIAAGVVTNAMLAGSITASNLVSSDITTVGTVTTGTWSATAIAATKGGTSFTSYALGDTIYSSATNVLSKLAGNTTSTKQLLSQTGTGSVSAAPAWAALVAGDIPNIAESQVTNLVSDLALKAPLASPTFTGVPAAPTAGAGTNTTQVATTAFVTAAITARTYSAAGSSTGTTITITRATHGLGTAGNSFLDVDVVVWDKSANPAVRVDVDTAVSTSNGDVTITFAASKTLSNYQVFMYGK